MYTRFLYLLKWCNLILILTTILCYISPYCSPHLFWPLAFLGLSYPILLFANLLFVITWALLKNKYFLFSIGCILMGYTHLSGFIGIGGLFNPGATNQENTLKIVSFNSYFIRIKESFKRARPETWNDLINDLDADVICFQEFPGRYRSRNYFEPYLKALDKLPYHTTSNSQKKELAIYSAYPIVNTQEKYFENKSNGYLLADIEVNGQLVRVLNVHLQSNAVSGIANKIAQKGNLQERETWVRVKGMMRNYRDGVKIRAKQAELIAELIQRSPYPLIVCGDFNDVPQSYAYGQISRELTDTFKAAGKGPGITYAGNVPMLRIDYILSSPIFKVCSAGVKEQKDISDHYPVWAILKLE